MIKIYENSKIYVLCPAYTKTGGTELLHQLVCELQKKNIEAYIVYNGIKDNNKNYTPKDFEVYKTKYVKEKEIIDDEQNILIIPEIQIKKVNDYKKIRKAIWWLSVDNYKKNYMFFEATKLVRCKTCNKNDYKWNNYIS